MHPSRDCEHIESTFRPFVIFSDVGHEAHAAEGLMKPSTLMKGVWYESSGMKASLGAFHSSRIVRDDSHPPGEYCILFERSRGLFIKTDFFGLYKLFYSTPEMNKQKLFVVSDCFNSISSFLKQSGEVLTFNESYICPLLCDGPNNFFYQEYGCETAIEQVNRLRPDEIISLTEQRIVSNDKFFGRYTSTEYQDLIESGVNRIAEVLRGVHESRPSINPRLYLSGGKDSRVSLAITMRALGLDDFLVATHEPAGYGKGIQEDYEVSARLVGSLNLKVSPWNMPLVGSSEAPLSSQMRRWNDIQSNAKFQFGPTKRRDIRAFSFEIRGGLGEAFRGYPYYYKGIVDKLGCSKGELRDDLVRWFDWVTGSSSLVCEDMLVRSREKFIEYAYSIPGDEVRDKLDMHYTLHRNRNHFSNILMGLRRNAGVIFPMQAPEFFWAANSLDKEERRSGKVLFDIIERTVPLLNGFEFQGGWRQRNSWRRRVKSVVVDLESPDSVMRRNYHSLDELVKQTNGMGEPASPLSERDLLSQISSAIERSLNVLADKTSSVKWLDVERRVIALSNDQKIQPLGMLLAKLSSMSDAWERDGPDYSLWRIDDFSG